MRHQHLDAEAHGDGGHERDDDGFGVAEALVLQHEQQQHVERGQADAHRHRDAEQQVEGQGAAQQLREVARDDRNFAEDPQRDRNRLRVVIAARLRQVAAGGDAQPHAQRLQQDGHQVGDEDHAEQRVAELRPARDVGGPVARVHVTDRDEVPRAEKRQQSPPRLCRQWAPRSSGRPREAKELDLDGGLISGAGSITNFE